MENRISMKYMFRGAFTSTFLRTLFKKSMSKSDFKKANVFMSQSHTSRTSNVLLSFWDVVFMVMKSN